MENFDVFGSKNLFFLCTVLRVSRQGISGSISLVLTIINLKVVIKKFLSQADLPGAQTLCVHKLAEVVVVGEYKHLMLRRF